MRPRISACVIVHDEERYVLGCLGPIQALVDEIVVLDTGSTDRTRELAARLGASVHETVWTDDFSAARNECLGYATGEWVLWLDADERIDAQNCQRLAALFERLEDSPVDAYQVRVVSEEPGGTQVRDRQTRIVRRSAARWQRRVHEELTPAGRGSRLEIRTSDIVIRHLGGEDSMRRRRSLERNLRLAQLELADRPEDPVALFDLGWDYLKMGRLPQAERLLQRSMAAGLCTRKLFALLAEAVARLGRGDEGLEFCNQGLIEFPDDPELLYRRGELLAEAGDLDAAQQTLVKLVNLGPQDYCEVGLEEGLRAEKARCLLGQICQEDDRWAEAELHYRTAIRHQPRWAQAWLGLGQVYLDAGHTAGAQHAIAELQQCPEGSHLLPELQAHALHFPAHPTPGTTAHR
jgi:tetratricopeptide (TPR) repeat protein